MSFVHCVPPRGPQPLAFLNHTHWNPWGESSGSQPPQPHSVSPAPLLQSEAASLQTPDWPANCFQRHWVHWGLMLRSCFFSGAGVKSPAVSVAPLIWVSFPWRTPRLCTAHTTHTTSCMRKMHTPGTCTLASAAFVFKHHSGLFDNCWCFDDKPIAELYHICAY